MPHSVEIPAPVKGTITDAAAIISPSWSTALRMSEAITPTSRGFSRPSIARSAMRRPQLGTRSYPQSQCCITVLRSCIQIRASIPHAYADGRRINTEGHDGEETTPQSRAGRDRRARSRFQGYSGEVQTRAGRILHHDAGKRADDPDSSQGIFEDVPACAVSKFD